MSGTTLSSCTKHSVDTVFVKHDSTILVHDTTNIHDTTYDFTSGMVAYYNFNGASLTDSSGFNNNIVFNNATPTKDRNGKDNNAYLFDGVSSYMRVANSASLNPNSITLHAIVKVNAFYHGAAHGNFILVKSWDQAYGMYMLQFSDFLPANPGVDTLHENFLGGYGDNPGNAGNASGVISSGNYVAKNTWYKLTYTYDGLVGKLYINGVLINSLVRTPIFTANSADVYIGRNNDPYSLYPFWFNGVIDEIRIYNRALPAKAVAQLVNVTN